MSKRTATWLAWPLWALSVAIASADVFISHLNDPSGVLSTVFGALVVLAFPAVGALIISRRPRNFIGWLLVVGMLLNALGGLALDYAVYTLLTAPHSLPGGEWMLWFGGWVRTLGFFTLIEFVPLFFPNGKVPSPRWRPVAWFAFGDIALNTLVTMFAPTNESELRLSDLPNPLGITIPPNIYDALSGISFLGMGAVTLLVVASVVVRFRHAKGEEREQLKWFAYAGVLAAIVFGVLLMGMLLLPPAAMANAGALFYLALAGFPIAVGIAILKYRLYDIDLIIRRTLVYSILTALLVLVYFGSVVVLQQIFVGISGERQSEIVTVVSTLAIAALFVPLRRRVQDMINQRFYRRKYDAQKVLARFAATVRDEVELEKLTGELLHVVNETMQPASVSLWLKPSNDRGWRME